MQNYENPGNRLNYAEGNATPAPVSFDDALRIAEGLDLLTEYSEKLAYWDSHFGNYPTVLFDPQKKHVDYVGIQAYIENYSDADFDRCRVFRITPNDVTEFWPFVQWCVEKCRFWNHFDIVGEEDYWKRIQGERFPEEYLLGRLAAAEKLRNRNETLPSPYGMDTISDELARDYFFWYGNQEASSESIGGLRVEAELYPIFMSMPARSLSEYGCIFSRFWHGCHTAMMVRFLRDQKKRLDNGETEESIRVPFVPSASTETPAPATSALPAPDQPPPPTYQTFADLFKDHADIDKCVEVLNSYEAGIRRNGTFYKYVVITWIDRLSKTGHIYTNSFSQIAPVLATEFNGLSIGRRTTSEVPIGAERAKEYFRHNIPHKPHIPPIGG